MNDLDDRWVEQELRLVEHTAPSALREAIAQMVAQGAPPSPSMHHRPWRMLVSVAATIAVVVGGLVWLGSTGDGTNTVPGNTEVVVEPTRPPTSTIDPIVVPGPDAPDPTAPDVQEDRATGVIRAMGLTSGDSLTGDDAIEALVVLQDHRTAVLRESTGFTATSEFGRTWELTDGSKPYPDLPPTEADVTVLANGDAWARFANGDVLHHDGPSGITRGLRAVDGSPVAWELRTIPFAHGFDQAIGHQPMMPIAWTDGPRVRDSITVTVDGDRRVAIDVLDERQRGDHSRHVVDVVTGLIVEYQSTQVDEKGTLGSYSYLTDVRIVDSLPADAAVELPDGLEWFRFENPEDLRAVGIDEARAAFGEGLVLPQSAVDEGTVALGVSWMTAQWSGVDPGDPEAALRSVSVNHVEPVGLLRIEVYLHTERPVDDGFVPDGYELVGDRLCMQPCAVADVPGDELVETVERGALAGAFDLRYGSGNLDGVFVSISAPTKAEMLTVAESFVAIQAT